MKKTLVLAVVSFFTLALKAQTIITTIAGGGFSLGDGGPAIGCKLKYPCNVAVDGAGNVYIADAGQNRIRKVNTSGVVSTFAGTGTGAYSGDGGPATSAEINFPTGMQFDKNGNLFFADNYNRRIRKIDPAGTITTVAGNGTNGYSGDGGAATSAQISVILSICVDSSGNLYFGDSDNDRIRKVSTSGLISTVAGTGVAGFSGDGGPAISAQISSPAGIAIDKSGNIYFSEHISNRVRKVSAAGIISTVIGTGDLGDSGDGGPATSAKLSLPYGLDVNVYGDIFLCDNNRIRMVHDGIITSIAGGGVSGLGDGGDPLSASFATCVGVTVDKYNNIYIADYGNERIRYIRNTVSVDQLHNERSINVYPNPSTGMLTVTTGYTTEPVTIRVTNFLGECVGLFPNLVGSSNTIQLDVPSGIYLISIISANEIHANKITIVK